MADKEIIQLEVQTGASLRNLEAMRAGLVGLRGALDRLEARARGGSSELLAEFNRLKSATAGIETSLGRAAGGAKRWGNEINFASGKAKALPGSLREATLAYNALAAQMGKTVTTSGALGNEVARTNRVKREAAERAREMTLAHDALHSAARGVSGVMGGLWLTYSRMLPVMLAVAGATKAIKDSISGGLDASFAAQFSAVLEAEKAFTTARAQGESSNAYGALDQSRNAIRTELVAISRDSAFTVEQNAQALKKLSLAGVSATDGLKLLTTAGNAAVLSQTDLGSATTMVLDTINNFGLASENSVIMADNYKRVADILAYTANTVNASFSDIAASFTNITGVAGTFNVAIEEASALLQSLAKTGVRGSRAGTFTRNFLDDLLGAPISQQAEKKLAELQVDRFDPAQYGEGEFGVAKYVDDLVASLSKLDFVEQQNAIRAITNARSRRLLRQELAEYQKGLKEVNGVTVQTNSLFERTTQLAASAEGSLSRMAEGLKGDVKYQFIMAQAAYNASAVAAFSGAEGALKSTAGTLQDLFKSVSFQQMMDDAVKGFAEFVRALADGVKTVLDFYAANKKLFDVIANGLLYSVAVGGVTALITVLTKAVTVTRLLNVTMLSNPVVAVAAGFALAAGAFDSYVKASQEAAKSMKGQLEYMQKLKKEEQDLQALIERRRTGTTTMNDFWTGSSDPESSLREVQNKIRIHTERMAKAFEETALKIDFNRVYEELAAETDAFLKNVTQDARSRAAQLRIDVESVLRQTLADQSRALATDVGIFEQALKDIDPAMAGAEARAKLLGIALDQLDERVRNVGDEMERLNRVELNRFLADAGQGLQFAFKDMAGLDSANDELEKRVELLAHGEDAQYKLTQAHIKAQIEMTKSREAGVAASLALTTDTDAIAHLTTLGAGLGKQRAGLEKFLANTKKAHELEQAKSASGGGGADTKNEKEAFKYIEQQKRLAEVGYQQAIDSVETYRKGLELRKGASMVGEKEYLTLQDELANLEIEHGLKREQAKQAAIKSQLGKVSGDGRERMLEMLKESLAEQSRLETKAIGERYLVQERAATELEKRTKTRSDAIMQIESASRNENLSEQEAHYGVQLDVQGRFLRDWMANEGKLMAGAVEDNDLPAQARLMKIFEAGNARATFKPDAASGYSEGMAGMDMVKSAEEAFRGTQEKLKAHLQINKEMYDVHFAKIRELYGEDADSNAIALQMKEQLENSYQQRVLELYVDSARERLELGTGGWEDMMLTSLDRVREGFTNFADGTSGLMGDFFTSFTDGFANSVGRAVVYSEDLNEAMKNIAREAIASLISGLVKLGIQWALTTFLQDQLSRTSMATNAVASQAIAATTAAAWAPAAAAVSLATFGTNAAPAMSGMALTHLLSQSLSSFAGFKDKGGMIPTGQWGIAGENGPEIVQGPARVTSTRDTAKMLGGGSKSLTIQQNFNVVVDGGGDGNKGEAQGAAIAQTMRREMKQAVIEVLVNEKRAGGVLA